MLPVTGGPPKGTQPEYLHEPYASTRKRAPTRPLILLPHTLSEVTGPVFGADDVRPEDGGPHPPAFRRSGRRSASSSAGRVLDEKRPDRAAKRLIEIWQCNAAGRLPAPERQSQCAAGPELQRRRPRAHGQGRQLPLRHHQSRAPYPWRNHQQCPGVPAHIHLSLFGRAFRDAPW